MHSVIKQLSFRFTIYNFQFSISISISLSISISSSHFSINNFHFPSFSGLFSHYTFQFRFPIFNFQFAIYNTKLTIFQQVSLTFTGSQFTIHTTNSTFSTRPFYWPVKAGASHPVHAGSARPQLVRTHASQCHGRDLSLLSRGFPSSQAAIPQPLF